MESKIKLHCDLQGKPNIVIDYNFNNGEDVRDKLVGIFINDLWPSGTDDQSKPVTLTMYCDKQTDGGMVAIIYKDERNEEVTTTAASTLKSTDQWLQQNLPHDLYKKWVDEVLYPKKVAAQEGEAHPIFDNILKSFQP